MDFFELPMKGLPSKLSTGQKNQFEVVLALSQGADYILMDEPFSGNDVFNREDFYKGPAGHSGAERDGAALDASSGGGRGASSAGRCSYTRAGSRATCPCRSWRRRARAS